MPTASRHLDLRWKHRGPAIEEIIEPRLFIVTGRAMAEKDIRVDLRRRWQCRQPIDLLDAEPSTRKPVHGTRATQTRIYDPPIMIACNIDAAQRHQPRRCARRINWPAHMIAETHNGIHLPTRHIPQHAVERRAVAVNIGQNGDAQLLFRLGVAAQRRKLLAQSVYFLALHLNQFAQGVKIFALDQIHIVDDALRLRLHHRLNLAPHPVGDTGRLVHHPAQPVKNPIVLVHGAHPFRKVCCWNDM